MDPAFVGYVLDPTKCRKLSMEERRALVYEVAKWPHGGPQMLESWSRSEILEVLAAENGKERKLTSWPKLKIIEYLLDTVAEKSKNNNGSGLGSEPDKTNTSKRQRKSDTPSRLQISRSHHSPSSSKGDVDDVVYCQNLACKAMICQRDEYCKSCSCFICHQYDENKDPSLWFACSLTPLGQGDSCGMSCHIECALKDKRDNPDSAFHGTHDGSFCCMYCGKVNDLHRSGRKLLVRAKESRCIDTLCSRLLLCQKIFKGSEKFLKVCEIVDTVIGKLEAEVGPIASEPVKTATGVVNKLSSAVEVQNLCASALESMDLLLLQPNYNMPDSGLTSSGPIQIENVSPTSHPSEGNESNNLSGYQDQINNQLGNSIGKAEIPDSGKLSDGTSKDLSESQNRSTGAEQGETPEHSVSAVNDECLMVEVGSLPIAVTHSESEKDCTTSIVDKQVSDNPKPENKQLPQDQLPRDISTNNRSNTPVGKGMEVVPFEHGSDCEPPSIRRKLVFSKDEPGRNWKPESANMANNNHVSGETQKQPRDGSFTKKRSVASVENCTRGESLEKEFEHCVKKVRWLECEGYIEKNFRLKFLTWYSLRATPEEMRVVKVYIDTLADDPVSLSAQLVHSFAERIFSKTASDVSDGFCARLWH